MKKMLFIAFLAILLTSPAYAAGGHGGGHGGGWGWRGDWIFPALIGGAIAYDLAYRYPVYAQPYPVYEQPYPVYAPSVAPQVVQYWYFCAATNAYYPYVPSCPSGWQSVPTTPPGVLSSAPYGTPAR